MGTSNRNEISCAVALEGFEDGKSAGDRKPIQARRACSEAPKGGASLTLGFEIRTLRGSRGELLREIPDRHTTRAIERTATPPLIAKALAG